MCVHGNVPEIVVLLFPKDAPFDWVVAPARGGKSFVHSTVYLLQHASDGFPP